MSKILQTLEENYIQFESHYIGVIIDNDGVIWFNANEIAIALGYSEPKQAIIKNVDKFDKIQLEKINTSIKINKHPHSIYINESGLYSLILKSRLKNTKKIKSWVTGKVLPSIRKYGYYKLKKDAENEMNKLRKKMAYIESQYDKSKRELKKDIFPNGGIVYIIDYSDTKKNTYRIGMTNNMNKRKQLYDTHSIYRKNVVHYEETTCPVKLESCVRAMLYDYRIKDRKDFYDCTLSTIKKAFKKCIESINCVNQSGGAILNTILLQLKKKVNKLQQTINTLDNNAIDDGAN